MSQTAGTFNQPNTIFVVFKIPSLSSTFTALFDTGNGNGANRNGIAITSEDTGDGYLFAGAQAPFSAGIIATDPVVYTAIFNGAASSLYNRTTLISSTLSPGTYPLTGTAVGGTSFGAPLACTVFEVLLYNSALSGPNIAATQSYLIHKWAL